jgi:hypothetical protein
LGQADFGWATHLICTARSTSFCGQLPCKYEMSGWNFALGAWVRVAVGSWLRDSTMWAWLFLWGNAGVVTQQLPIVGPVPVGLQVSPGVNVSGVCGLCGRPSAMTSPSSFFFFSGSI